MRHLPAITHHLCHVFSPLSASRHAHRHLLLAGRCDVTASDIRSRDSDGVLHHNDVILYVTGKEKGVLYDPWTDDWLGTPDRIDRHYGSTITRSSRHSGRNSRRFLGKVIFWLLSLPVCTTYVGMHRVVAWFHNITYSFNSQIDRL